MSRRSTSRPSRSSSENAKKLEVFGAVNTGETVVQDVDWYAKNFNEATTKLTNWLAG